MTPRLGFCIVLALSGVVLLCLALWARSGFLPGSRSWMNVRAENWMLERLVLLGLPIAGLALLAVAAVGAPLEGPALRIIGGALLVLLIIPTLYFLASPIPLAMFVFPRWAQPLRRRRAAQWAALTRRL